MVNEGYFFRVIINGTSKDIEIKEGLIDFIRRELNHPCFMNIRSFHSTKNIIMERGFSIER